MLSMRTSYLNESAKGTEGQRFVKALTATL